jgi:hypothetical protein
MKSIVLKVCKHQSGRYTATQSIGGSLPSDLPGPLFGNTDKADFDRALSDYVAELKRKGDDVEVVESHDAPTRL